MKLKFLIRSSLLLALLISTYGQASSPKWVKPHQYCAEDKDCRIKRDCCSYVAVNDSFRERRAENGDCGKVLCQAIAQEYAEAECVKHRCAFRASSKINLK